MYTLLEGVSIDMRAGSRSNTLKQQAYEEIRSAIYSDRYQPGHPLGEEALSRELGISRTPIHAALQQLIYDRLAERDETGHVYVSRLTEEDVHDMTVMRLALEPLAISESSSPADAHIIRQLEEIVKAQKEIYGKEPLDQVRFSELDGQFHVTLSHLCSNRLLQETLENIHHIMVRYNILSGTLSSNAKAAIEEHEQIILYLKKEQKDFAGLAVRNHILSVSERIFSEEDQISSIS